MPTSSNFAKAAVAGGDLAFALQNVDLDRLLVVDDGGKGHRVLERDGRVARDKLYEKAAARFQAEAQRQDVQQHDVLHVAGKNAALDRRAHGDDFVRIDLGRRFFAEYLGDRSCDDRRAGLAADQNHFVDVRRLKLGVPQSFLARLDGDSTRSLTSSSNFVAGKCRVDVLRPGSVRRDEGQADARFVDAGKLAFGPLGGFLQTLKGETVVL